MLYYFILLVDYLYNTFKLVFQIDDRSIAVETSEQVDIYIYIYPYKAILIYILLYLIKYSETTKKVQLYSFEYYILSKRILQYINTNDIAKIFFQGFHISYNIKIFKSSYQLSRIMSEEDQNP